MVPLQERKRKKNYNESDYYRDLQAVDSRSSGGGSRQAKPKSIQVRHALLRILRSCFIQGNCRVDRFGTPRRAGVMISHDG